MAALTLKNPYETVDWTKTQQIRGQFHTHTNRPKDSDGHSGSHDAHEIVDFYETAGFGALTLGDHESRGPPPLTWPWTELTAIESTWENRIPIGSHTVAGPDDVTVDMVAVPGLELGRVRDPEDMVSLFSHLATSPSDDNVETLATVAERGGIAWLSHPSAYGTAEEWGERWWREAFTSIDACLGMEIFNPGYNADESVAIWDAALTDLLPERSVWGFAGDDLHTIGDAYPQAWQAIVVEEHAAKDVRMALEEGWTFPQHRIGADDGDDPPEIRKIEVDHETAVVHLDAAEVDEIVWISNGSVVGEGNAFEITPTHNPYVRGVVRNGAGETCTQPIAIEP